MTPGVGRSDSGAAGTLAGPGLGRLFVTSIAFDLGDGMQPTDESGWLLAIDGLGATGSPEPRFALR